VSELRATIKRHLLDQTLLNDGATVLNPFGLACVPIVGFVVGNAGFSFDFEALENPQLWDGAMLMVEGQLGPLMIGPMRGVGTWKCNCGSSLHVHVDAVQWTNSRQHARLLCHQYEQQAYYDVEKGESVYVRDDDESEAPPYIG